MKKKIKKFLSILAVFSMLVPTLVYAAPEKPPGEGGQAPGGMPGSSSTSSSASYSGATTISSNTSESNKTYSSTTGSQNALLVSGGTSTLSNISVNKTGDSSGDDADFYGTNAAILAYNNAVLTLKGGNITTSASHANAVFSYGTGKITLSNTTINTTGNNSGGVMVTGGGTLTANSCTVNTKGNSSAAIRSDRGGGTLTVNKGTYKTSGQGSPAIYSTADITVNDATLTSTSSEGVVVEGANSVTLNNVKLTDTNNTLNGNSETYKNIFLYQSMSGDADSGTASFTSKNSNIITNKGDTIFVTNTTATINLENNTITNNDGNFLRIQTGKWGNSGSNGGNVTLNMTNQKVEGNVIVDNISTLDVNMQNKSVLIGAINSSNTAKSLTVKLSKDSVISLTGDTYLTSLDNEDTSNSNIYLNGYSLYVNGKKVSANNGTYNDNSNATTKLESKAKEENNNYIYYIAGAVVFVGVITTIVIVCNKKRKKRLSNQDEIKDVSND